MNIKLMWAAARNKATAMQILESLKYKKLDLEDALSICGFMAKDIIKASGMGEKEILAYIDLLKVYLLDKKD